MKNIQNNNGKKKFRPMGKVWERPGRGHGSELFVFFCFSMVFCSLAKNLENTKKKVQTHGQGLGYPHTNQKTKKPKNQETKKTKKQKTKKKKKTRLHTPRGGGQMQSVGSCLFGFFGFFGFLVFWFFGFLVSWFFGFLVKVWERPGRGHGSELFVFFWCFHGFLQFGQKPREHKKKSSDPWARSGLSTHKPKNQKTKKPRNQKTKKPKNQKKTKKPRLHTPRGGGQMHSVGSCLFGFFVFFGFLVFWFFGFLVFWFFGFLVCVWIAIADVPSRDCQALSVVALEARSIHYSTAMFAMT